MKKGEIVIIAGSQGIDKKNDILTLGDGGPETIAVAIGVAIPSKTYRNIHKSGWDLYSRF